MHSLGSKQQCEAKQNDVIKERAKDQDEGKGTDNLESETSFDMENIEEFIEDEENEDGRNKDTGKKKTRNSQKRSRKLVKDKACLLYVGFMGLIIKAIPFVILPIDLIELEIFCYSQYFPTNNSNKMMVSFT